MNHVTVRKLENYRVRLPKEWCDKYEISSSDFVDIKEKDNSLIIKKRTTTCLFCGQDKSLIGYKGSYLICKDCLKGLLKEYGSNDEEKVKE